MFADDTTMILKDKSLAKLEEKANKEIKIIHDWFTANKLTLNENKTKYMIFGQKSNQIKIVINQKEIERVKEEEKLKFLGIIIEEKLQWKYQLEKVIQNIRKGVFALKQIKNLVNQASRKMIYHALVTSHLSYGITIWYASLNKKQRMRLFRVQKQAIRALCGVRYNAHTSPLFAKTGILKVEDIYTKECCLFIMRRKLDKVPKVISEKLVIKEKKHNTRNNKDAYYYVKNELINSNLNKIIWKWNISNFEFKGIKSITGGKKIINLEIIKKYKTVCDIHKCYICRN